MSEEVTEPTAEDEATAPPEPAEDTTDWKAEARKWEQRAKTNKEASERLQELEDAQKSDADKQAERLAELESTSKTSSAEAARLRVALRKGLTETQAKRLVGDTVEDLEADADDLLASFKTEEPADNGGRPKERLRPGASPSTGPEPSPTEMADAVIKASRGF